jgi:recombination protein RecA
VRLDIRRIGQIKSGEEIVGSRVRVKVVKNKCAPPFRQAEFEVMYGAGVNQLGELVDLGATHGLLEKSGAWFLLDGERIGQGRDRACAFLGEHPEIAESLRDRLLSAMKTAIDAAPAPKPFEDDAANEAGAAA